MLDVLVLILTSMIDNFFAKNCTNDIPYSLLIIAYAPAPFLTLMAKWLNANNSKAIQLTNRPWLLQLIS